MSIPERIQKDMAAAMKAQQTVRLQALRMAKAALQLKEIEKKAPLDDAEAAKVLQTLVKQREEAAAQFRHGNRPELADKEEAELRVLKSYLPEEASEADIAAAVDKAIGETGATTPKDLGKVMQAALAGLRAAGKPVDGKKVNEAARKRLGG
jgi:uncharacterized protein YqeY